MLVKRTTTRSKSIVQSEFQGPFETINFLSHNDCYFHSAIRAITSYYEILATQTPADNNPFL